MTDHPASSAHGFTEGSDEPGGIAEQRCVTSGEHARKTPEWKAADEIKRLREHKEWPR